MPGLLESVSPGRGYLSTRNILFFCAALLLGLLPWVPASPAYAAVALMLPVLLASSWIMSRGVLEGITLERTHSPRIFEDDRVDVQLKVSQSSGLSQYLILVEDQFLASLSVYRRCLIPMMSPDWTATLRYSKDAERHRGLYLIGPARLWAADPMGTFFRTTEADCVTRLTVYPRAVPLGDYVLLGPKVRSGPGMENRDRVGQAEEILSVRPYQMGDPWTRIHWRTSVRRRELHIMELDTHVQTEVALYLDLTRRGRFGTGAESTTETAIGCATSLLTQASSLRHRISITLVRETVESLPAGVGIAQLHLLLDRLAFVSFEGNLHFWESVVGPASLLPRGSRAVFVSPVSTTSPEVSCELIHKLGLRGVSVDVILLDDSKLARIWSNQSPPAADAEVRLMGLKLALQRAGARVLVLERGETAARLLPEAAHETPAGLAIT